MRSFRFALVSSAALLASVFGAAGVCAAPAGNDPCKVLTAEKFSQIMGYAATVNKTASTQTACFLDTSMPDKLSTGAAIREDVLKHEAEGRSPMEIIDTEPGTEREEAAAAAMRFLEGGTAAL